METKERQQAERKFIQDAINLVGPAAFEAKLRGLKPTTDEAQLARRRMCWKGLIEHTTKDLLTAGALKIYPDHWTVHGRVVMIKAEKNGQPWWCSVSTQDRKVDWWREGLAKPASEWVPAYDAWLMEIGVFDRRAPSIAPDQEPREE